MVSIWLRFSRVCVMRLYARNCTAHIEACLWEGHLCLTSGFETDEGVAWTGNWTRDLGSDAPSFHSKYGGRSIRRTLLNCSQLQIRSQYCRRGRLASRGILFGRLWTCWFIKKYNNICQLVYPSTVTGYCLVFLASGFLSRCTSLRIFESLY